MVGLIRKDLNQLKYNWFKWYIISLGIFSLILINYYLKTNSVIYITFISLLMINNIQSLFIKDTSNGWLKWIQSLGIKSTVVICARYATLLLVCNFSAIISLLYMLIGIKWLYGMSMQNIYIICGSAFFISIIYGLIVLPFLYAFEQNGLTIAVIAIFGVCFCLIKFTKITVELSRFFKNFSTSEIISIAVIIIIIFLLISYLVSYNIYIYKNRA